MTVRMAQLSSVDSLSVKIDRFYTDVVRYSLVAVGSLRRFVSLWMVNILPHLVATGRSDLCH